MTVTLEAAHDQQFELFADAGTMRMLLMCALADANLWTRAVGASQETKNHWARRATLIRGLLEQMPPPANPRDPYEDLPDEPTPEEAAARWRERAAAEDLRRDAAKAAVANLPHTMPGTTIDLLGDDLPAEPDPGPTIDDIEDLLAI